MVSTPDRRVTAIRYSVPLTKSVFSSSTCNPMLRAKPSAAFVALPLTSNARDFAGPFDVSTISF